MNKLKQKVENSAEFYETNMLDIDYKQAEFVYKSINPYFVGKQGLELGPSMGYMTKNLVDDFENLEIVDGAQKLIDSIPNYPNVTKVCSMFEDYVPNKKFDTVIMSHVLEHIEEPVEVLKRIKTWVAVDGVFIVAVPNAKSIHRLAAAEMELLSSIYELNDRDKQLGHYRVYDMEILEKHIKQAGFKIKNKGGSFLKPLSNGQINKNWNEQMIEGFYKVGKYFPENCAEIYCICSK